jgi:hypothetical protein
MDDARTKRLTVIACILNIALPALRADLDASLADQQWVVEAYPLLLASLILVDERVDAQAAAPPAS